MSFLLLLMVRTTFLKCCRSELVIQIVYQYQVQALISNWNVPELHVLSFLMGAVQQILTPLLERGMILTNMTGMRGVFSLDPERPYQQLYLLVFTLSLLR